MRRSKNYSKHDQEFETDIRFHVCTDEEAVESLATRLRPFIVRSESIYLSRVLDAVASTINPELLTENEKKAFESVQTWFDRRYENKNSKRYSVQLVNEEGVPQTDLISDAQIAESWIYTDTVHADPKKDNKKAQELGYFERYRAASSYFCEFALMVVSLLNIIRSLTRRKLLHISEEVWNLPVTYDEAKTANDNQVIVDSVYVLPVGTEVSSDFNPHDIPGSTRLTPTVMRSLAEPEGTASIIAIDQDGNLKKSYFAFCELREDSFVFHIEEIGELVISKESLLRGSGPEGSISFRPNESRISEVEEFIRSVLPPNILGLKFVYEGQSSLMPLQLSIGLKNNIDDTECEL